MPAAAESSNRFEYIISKMSSYSRFHVDRPIVFFLFGYLFGSIGDEWQFGSRVPPRYSNQTKKTRWAYRHENGCIFKFQVFVSYCSLLVRGMSGGYHSPDYYTVETKKLAIEVQLDRLLIKQSREVQIIFIRCRLPARLVQNKFRIHQTVNMYRSR